MGRGSNKLPVTAHRSQGRLGWPPTADGPIVNSASTLDLASNGYAVGVAAGQVGVIAKVDGLTAVAAVTVLGPTSAGT